MTEHRTKNLWMVVAISLLSPVLAFASTSFNHNGGQGTGVGGPHALTRMIKDGAITDFIYDDNGSLEAEIQGGVTKTYSYFVGGKLKQKTAGGQKTTFFINTSGEKVAVYAEGGSRPSKIQIFQNSSLEFTNDVPRFTYGGDARTSEDGSTVHFFVKDHLGSIVATLSPNGVESRRDYLPYGQDWFREDRTVEDNGFNGNREEAGLLDYGARHYNPETGKFIEADTIIPHQDAVGFNRYAYVSNNPINRIDPSGHGDAYVFTDHNRSIWAGYKIRQSMEQAPTLVTFDTHADVFPQRNVGDFLPLADGGSWSAYSDSVSLAGWIAALVPYDIIDSEYVWVEPGNNSLGASPRRLSAWEIGRGSSFSYLGSLTAYTTWFGDLPGISGSVWLDIDLDYFYSRDFNAGSSFEQAQIRTREVLEALDHQYGDQIEGISIARSPEYFNTGWNKAFEKFFLDEIQCYGWACNGVEWHVDDFSDNRQPLDIRKHDTQGKVGTSASVGGPLR